MLALINHDTQRLVSLAKDTDATDIVAELKTKTIGAGLDPDARLALHYVDTIERLYNLIYSG